VAASGVLHRPGREGLGRLEIVDPLPRARAQMLLGHLAQVAAQFNRTGVRNKYEIDSIAVFNGYMAGDDDLTELSIGSRAGAVRRRSGR